MHESHKGYRRIKLKPHVEAYGLRGLEWSYHFPLEPGLRIVAELELSFPEDKVPGAARSSLTQADLVITRLSFADTASEVRSMVLRFLLDSKWIVNKFPFQNPDNPATIVQSRAWGCYKYFVHRAREYWNPGVFSKMAVLLQSDQKQHVVAFIELLRSADFQSGLDWEALANRKRELCSVFRTVARLIETLLLWEKIFEGAAHEGVSEHDLPADALQFRVQLRDLAEFAIMITHKTLAELQDAVGNACKTAEEVSHALGNAHLRHSKEFRHKLEIMERQHQLLLDERRWLIDWIGLATGWSLLCGFQSLSEVSNNPDEAEIYFERMRELVRNHYQAWDLAVDLKPNEARLDFWVGAWAATVSAAFAFFATYLLIIMFFREASLTGMSAIAVGLFALANTIVYVLKDRMKEWVKLGMRKRLKIKQGRWSGVCSLAGPAVEKVSTIAHVQRETEWQHKRGQWIFSVGEKFRIIPYGEEVSARIIKQVWRLPLDEILDSLDSTKHFLRLPSLDGKPVEVPVLKKNFFSYRVRVKVLALRNRHVVTLDVATGQGRIMTTGDRITNVE